MKSYAKTPTILQMEATECGAASLAMVLAYHGRYVPLEQMRIETAVSRDGVNAANIAFAAKRLGLECHCYRKKLESLRSLFFPCIIHWNFNHFVVLEGFKGKYAYLNDPAIGRRKLTIDELDQGYTGIVLTFTKTNAFVKEKKQSNTIPFILSRLNGNKGVIFKLIYVGLLLVIPGLILPVLSQVYIDDILLAGYKDWLIRLLLFMLGCLVLKGGLSYYRRLILTKLKGKMSLVNGYQFLMHMFGLPISFFSQRYAGDLVNRLDNNDGVNDFLAGNLAETVLNIFTAIFYFVILLFYSPILTGVGLIGLIANLVIAIISNKYLANASQKLQMAMGKLYGSICAGINISDTIKSSGVEVEYANRIIAQHADYASQEQKLTRFQQVISAIPSVTGQITDVFILMLGAILVIRGQFTTGMLVAFSSLFDSFASPINSMLSFFKDLQTVKSNIKRVEDIEHYPSSKGEKKSYNTELIGNKLTGRVELRNISFGYSMQQAPIIHDFNFKLHSGESIAFVGPSGCGKSTVSKLVSGLYDAWEGQVLFDGVPIDQIDTTVLHSSVATVSQNLCFFSGTIRDNISMWNPAIPEADIIAAAKDACIHDFIMTQPGAYDHLLSENANNLSGGQRQRLEIARALAINPSILVMDEATSALDPIVEKKIIDNIQRRGCTCIIVAHRLSAIRDCNEIIVMNRGNIIQRGTHDSMKNEDGFYKAFVANL